MICGPELLLDLHQRAERHHLALRVAHLEPADVLGLEPKPLVGLDPDLVGAAELVEIVDVRRAQRCPAACRRSHSSGTPRLLAFTRSTSA